MVNTGCLYNGPNPRLWRWEHFFIDEPNEFFIDGQNWFLCQFHNDLMDFGQNDNICDGISNVIGQEALKTTYSIVPNPFTKSFFVRSEHSEAIHYLRIFNMAGQVVLEKEQPSRIVDAGRLLPGLYYIEIISKSGEQHFVRAVRQ
ncbi:MAG: T9SS type A sorting domain-containing protein [Saprospiraceae bacterium]|nr:T9SS type A sorting domain-containing protein [Saprospiraceae bacterium]